MRVVFLMITFILETEEKGEKKPFETWSLCDRK